MDTQPQPRQLVPSILAIVLWLVSFVLGLQAIYDLMQIISVIRVSLGTSLQDAQLAMPVLVFFLALLFLIFIIWSTEYHLKRVGKPESWRLFGWTIAVELSIILLNYFL
ncbi:MAG TPA: hypothetical protein VFY25_13135, partial [Anaerolineales bacterium]|nr:hypothetical protein [Anaerolineales bacterium]